MDWLNETSVWTSKVESLETTDDVKGSSGGDPNSGESNQPHLSLAKRTQWLRAQHIILENAVNANITQITQNITDITNLQNNKYDKTGGPINGNTEWQDRIVEFKGVTAVVHYGAGAIMHLGAGQILHAGAGDIEHQGAGDIKHTAGGHIKHTATGNIEHTGAGKILHSGSGNIEKDGTAGGNMYGINGAAVGVVDDGILVHWGNQVVAAWVFKTWPEGQQCRMIDHPTGLASSQDNTKRFIWNAIRASTVAAGGEVSLLRFSGTGAIDDDHQNPKINNIWTSTMAVRLKAWGQVNVNGTVKYVFGEKTIYVAGGVATANWYGFTFVDDLAASPSALRFDEKIQGASLPSQADSKVGGIYFHDEHLYFWNNTATLPITNMSLGIEIELLYQNY